MASLNNLLVKFEPVSLCTTLGIPYVVKTLISTGIMTFVVILCKGITSGYLVQVFIIVNKN